MAIDKTGEWVDVYFVQDSEYYDISEMGPQEMAEHMAQWDAGTETDGAHTTDGAQWGTYDREYEIEIGCVNYVLAIGDMYASLNRRPVGGLFAA